MVFTEKLKKNLTPELSKKESNHKDTTIILDNNQLKIVFL